MHYYLFQDLYEWAGKTMSKEEIANEAEDTDEKRQ